MNPVEKAVADALQDHEATTDITECPYCGAEFDTRKERRHHQFDAGECPEVSELQYQ